MSYEVTGNAKAFAANELNCATDELTVQSVSGGHSRNRKSLVGVGGKWLFVKEVDVSLLPDDGSEELGWLKKEFELTRYLRTNGFAVAPEWSKLSEDGVVLLLPAYRAEDGWVWGYPTEPTEQRAYVDAVIHTVKELETASFPPAIIAAHKLQPFFRDELAFDDGFQLLMHDEMTRAAVISKFSSLINVQYDTQLEELQGLLLDLPALESLARSAMQLADQPNDAFGHCDVRSDNLAYNTLTHEVKFVDWNWASFTPDNFGTTEFLIDTVRNGIDITPWEEYLNPQMLAALVGYFARHCIKDPLKPGDTLRDRQAASAATSYQLFKQLQTI